MLGTAPESTSEQAESCTDTTAQSDTQGHRNDFDKYKHSAVSILRSVLQRVRPLIVWYPGHDMHIRA